MTTLLPLCGIVLITAISSLLLKKSHVGQACLVGSVGLLLLFSPILTRYQEAAETIHTVLLDTDFAAYGQLMLKALGIGLTVKFTADTCRDMGEETLAGGLELAGKLEILLLCLPLCREMLTMLQEIMG